MFTSKESAAMIPTFSWDSSGMFTLEILSRLVPLGGDPGADLGCAKGIIFSPWSGNTWESLKKLKGIQY